MMIKMKTMKPLAVIGWSLLIIIVAGVLQSIFTSSHQNLGGQASSAQEKSFTTINISGVGNQLTDDYFFEKGFYVVNYRNTGRHMAVLLLDNEGDVRDAIINTLSDTAESTSFKLGMAGNFRLQIEAMDDGNWKILIEEG